MVYAVIDTNVIVSAMLSRVNSDSATAKVLEYVFLNEVIPVYNEEIIEEYIEVLNRPKFKLNKESIDIVLTYIKNVGYLSDRTKSSELFNDKDNVVFYEVALSHLQKEKDTFLVTGNIKHFPDKPFVVSPRELVDIISNKIITF